MEKIKIYDTALRPTDFRIHSTHQFFNEPVKINVSDDKIIFEHITIDDNHYITPYQKGNGWSIFLQNDYLEKGVYLIDEDESNEDQLVVYFEDKIIET